MGSVQVHSCLKGPSVSAWVATGYCVAGAPGETWPGGLKLLTLACLWELSFCFDVTTLRFWRALELLQPPVLLPLWDQKQTQCTLFSGTLNLTYLCSPKPSMRTKTPQCCSHSHWYLGSFCFLSSKHETELSRKDNWICNESGSIELVMNLLSFFFSFLITSWLFNLA